MFDLFRKKRWRYEGPQKVFFDGLFAQLPDDLRSLKEASDRGLYRGIILDPGQPDSYSVLYSLDPKDPAIRRGVSFKLNGLVVQEGIERLPLSLSIHDGLWIGFRFPLRPDKLDGRVVDVSGLERENTVRAKIPSGLVKLLDGLHCGSLDLVSFGEVDLNDKTYYSIRDLDDGGMMVIDVKGQVFRATHDPFNIELIESDIRKYVADVNAGYAQVE